MLYRHNKGERLRAIRFFESLIALLLFCFISQLMEKMSKMGENRKKTLKRIIIGRKNVKKNHKKWRKTIEIGFVL